MTVKFLKRPKQRWRSGTGTLRIEAFSRPRHPASSINPGLPASAAPNGGTHCAIGHRSLIPTRIGPVGKFTRAASRFPHTLVRARCLMPGDTRGIAVLVATGTIAHGLGLPVGRREEARHVVVDATGVKIYGAGQWHVRKYGALQRRTWRKLHLGIDETTSVASCLRGS